MPKVKQRYNHVFNHSVATGATFTSNVYVPFIPDEMIVREVSYNGVNAGETDKNILVWCDFLNQVVAVTTDLSVSVPQSIFDIGKSVNGLWKFECRQISGDLVNPVNTGKQLTILVEFLQY